MHHKVATATLPTAPRTGTSARGQQRNRRGLAGARRFPIDDHAVEAVVFDNEMRDLVLTDDPSTSYPGIETFTSLGSPRHFRVTGSGNESHGSYEYCEFEDGFLACVCDITYLAPLPVSMMAEDMLRVLISSESDGEYAPAGGELLNLKGPSAAIIIEPPGQPPAASVMAGHMLAVHVYICSDALNRLFGCGSRDLPPVIQDFMTGRLRETVARRLPLSPQLLRFLDDLRVCVLEGQSRRLVMRSKAVEILCHAFDALAHDGAGGRSPEASKLAASGVMKAQRLLSENFVSPPSLDHLAQEVGLSRSGLCAAFRQIVGQSVYDYVADLRMQHALVMLNQESATIAEIAYAVGYGHPSSFSVAVQRRFGTTASELRRRGLPPP